MKEEKMTLWEKYLCKEIGIELKACLYFFAVLFFYCCYRIYMGLWDASIIHMAEMIFLCYVLEYIIVFLFGNFDEAEKIGLRENVGIAVCTGIFTLAAFLGNWFDGKLWILALFAAYMIFMYICVILIFRIKRRLDDRLLNEELKAYQRGAGSLEKEEKNSIV